MPNSSTTRTELDYTIKSSHKGADRARRIVDVHASPDDLAAFARDGYLVRESLIDGDRLNLLREALCEISDRELYVGAVAIGGGAFGGAFFRHLMDKHPAFLELLQFEPTLSIARAMLGPQVQVLPMTARISYPGEPEQQTEWHIHQRVVPEPYPPFFTYPHVIDTLIYLDDVDEASGPVCVVPGTHLRHLDELPMGDFNDKPGQVKLTIPAGSVVMIHGNLWHRALPTLESGHLRRLLILPYAAAWLQLPSFGERPVAGLLRAVAKGADEETRELLGDPEGLY